MVRDEHKQQLGRAWHRWRTTPEGRHALDDVSLVDAWQRFAPGSDEELETRLRAAYDAGAEAYWELFTEALLAEAKVQGLTS